jgi:mannose-1-phosphate guanylyltransferase
MPARLAKGIRLWPLALVRDLNPKALMQLQSDKMQVKQNKGQTLLSSMQAAALLRHKKVDFMLHRLD